MPEIALDIPFARRLIPWAVASESIANEEQKGIYVPVYCPIREEVVAYIFHRTRRTDIDGRIVYALVGIQLMTAMAEQAETALAEMKPVTGVPQ